MKNKNTLQVKVHIQQESHDEHGTKFILRFNVLLCIRE